MGTDLKSQDSPVLHPGLELCLKAGGSVCEKDVECADIQEGKNTAAAAAHAVVKEALCLCSSGDNPSKSSSTPGEICVPSPVSEKEGFPEMDCGYSLNSYMSDFKSSGSSDWSLFDMNQSYIDGLLGKLDSPTHPPQTEQKQEEEEDIWEDNRCPSTFCVSNREESWPMQHCVEDACSSTVCVSDTANSQPVENVADITIKLDETDQNQIQKNCEKAPPAKEKTKDCADCFQQEHLNEGKKAVEKTLDCPQQTKKATKNQLHGSNIADGTMRKKVCVFDKSHPSCNIEVELPGRQHSDCFRPAASSSQTVFSPSSQIISEEHLQALQLLGLSDHTVGSEGTGDSLSRQHVPHPIPDSLDSLTSSRRNLPKERENRSLEDLPSEVSGNITTLPENMSDKGHCFTPPHYFTEDFTMDYSYTDFSLLDLPPRVTVGKSEIPKETSASPGPSPENYNRPEGNGGKPVLAPRDKTAGETWLNKSGADGDSFQHLSKPQREDSRGVSGGRVIPQPPQNTGGRTGQRNSSQGSQTHLFAVKPTLPKYCPAPCKKSKSSSDADHQKEISCVSKQEIAVCSGMPTAKSYLQTSRGQPEVPCFPAMGHSEVHTLTEEARKQTFDDQEKKYQSDSVNKQPELPPPPYRMQHPCQRGEDGAKSSLPQNSVRTASGSSQSSKPVVNVPQSLDVRGEAERRTMDADCKTVIVKGPALDKDQQDLCYLYFQNKKRSGGEEIEEEDIVWNEEQRCFFITFGESHVARRVASRTHTLRNSPVQVHLWTCGGRPAVAVHDNRVWVTGLPPDTTQECLQNYLECTTEFDVDSVQVNRVDNSALVIFQSPGEKPDIQEMNHACQKSPLDEGVRLSFHGVPVSSTGRPVPSRESVPSRGSPVPSRGSPVPSRGSPVPSKGSPVPRGVTVAGLNPDTANENIWYYFSNKRRSAGGRVSYVDRTPGSSVAYVQFENPADAESVIRKGAHTLDGRELIVCCSKSSDIRDRPGLQEAVSPQAAPSARAASPGLRGSSEEAGLASQSYLETSHMIRNTHVPPSSLGKKEFGGSQNSSLAGNAQLQYDRGREQRDSRTSDHGGLSGPSLYRHRGPAPSFSPTGSEASRNPQPQFPTMSPEVAYKTTEIELGEDVIWKFESNTPLLKTFITDLKSLSCQFQWKRPDHIVITCHLVEPAWNWKRNAAEMLNHFVQPIKKEMQRERNRSSVPSSAPSTFVSDKQTPASSRSMEDAVPNLKSGQMKILRMPKVLEQLKRKHPGLEILVDEDKRSAIVTAPETSMKKTFSDVLSFLLNIREIKVPLTPALAQMYRKNDAITYIQNSIENCGALCHWEACDGHITVTADHSDLEHLEKAIISAFKEDPYTLSESEACLMKSPTGISFMDKMQEVSRGECPAPVLLLEEKQVYIVDIPSNIGETRLALKKFLNENQLENEVIQVHPNHARCLQEYFKEEQEAVLKKAGDVGVSVSFAQTGITAKGPKDSLAEIVGQVKELVSRIKENKMTFKEPGVTRYLTGPKGQEFLSKTGKDTGCYITTGGASTDSADHQLLAKIMLDSNHQILIVQGDITRCRVDAIVNAANEDLSHGGGVALAIAKAGGQTIQDESSEIVAKGRLREGQVAVTRAGSLLCSHVLHAVGPTWSGGHNSEEELLACTVKTILGKAEAMKLTSVAMPAISCGIFRYPVIQATNTIIQAIAQHFKSIGRSSCLNKLTLIDQDSKSLNGFLAAAKLHFNKLVEVVGTPKSSGLSERRGGSQASGHTPDQDSRSDRGAHGSKRHAPIKIISGDIARSKADVIVCATHPSLDLRKGVLSKSLLEKGGETIQQELREFSKNHGMAELGKVVETSGGNLSCKAVYHLSLPRWRDDHGKKMRQAVEKCLDTASKKNAQSIAFPTLGTGRLGYPGDQVASIMFSAIGDWFQKNSHSSLKEVQIIVFNRDTDTLEAFKREEKEGGDSHNSHRHSGSSQHGGGRHGGHGHRENKDRERGRGEGSLKTQVGRVTVMVKQGNILAEPCDAIVNSTNDSLDLSFGVLSKEISKACGPGFERECKSQRRTMGEDGVAITKVDASDLACGNVIHVSGERFKRDWQGGILSVLRLAEEEGLSSVSMPALGTGNRGADPVELAEAMQRAVSQFSDQAHSVKEVRVVVFKHQLLAPYVAAFDPGAASGGEDDSGTREGGTAGDHSSEKTQSVDVHICSNQLAKINEARDQIYKHVKQICSSHTEASPLIASFNSKQREELFKLQNKRGVEIVLDQKKSTVTIKGVEIDVAKALGDVKDIILSAMTQQHLAAGMPPVRWQYETGKDKFADFDPELVISIEAAYKKREKEVYFSDKRGRKYKIVFKENKEYPLDRPGQPVKVKRRDLMEEKQQEIPLPTHWDPMKGAKVKRVALKPDSSEYKKVATHFGAANIKKIERIQNPTLFQQFKIKKKEMEMYNPKGTENEKRLFHGTPSDSVEGIITNGFNRSYSGRHGTALGNGVYFAVNSSVSKGFASGGQMFQARVLVGEHAQGSSGLRMAPNKPNDPKRPYDSVSDNPRNGSVFVIFHDSQAYPEYLITFQ